MRNYEVVYIVRPEVDSDGLAAIQDSIKSVVERDGGAVVKVEPWGTRPLAYPINDQREGQYVLLQLQLEPVAVADLERSLKLNEQVIRHLVVRLEEVAETSKPEEAQIAPL